MAFDTMRFEKRPDARLVPISALRKGRCPNNDLRAQECHQEDRDYPNTTRDLLSSIVETNAARMVSPISIKTR